jgi:hypothetical protein
MQIILESITLEPFTITNSSNGTLVLYEISMQDGSEKVLINVPLRFE